MSQERDYLKGFRKFAVPGPSDNAGIDDMRQYLVEVVEAANDHAGCAARYAHHSRDAEVALLAREVKELERLAVKAAELKTAAVVKDSLKSVAPVVGGQEPGCVWAPQVINKRSMSRDAMESNLLRVLMPPGGVYVGRPTKWGNKFLISDPLLPPGLSKAEKHRMVVDEYRKWIKTQPELLAALDELRGKDLVCWCAPLPCHADVLLELANGPLTCGLVIDDCPKLKRVVDQDIEDEQKAVGIREVCGKCCLGNGEG